MFFSPKADGTWSVSRAGGFRSCLKLSAGTLKSALEGLLRRGNAGFRVVRRKNAQERQAGEGNVVSVSDSTIQVVSLTCSHCGHEKQFARESLLGRQLYELETRACERCGGAGSVVVLSSHAAARIGVEKFPH